MSVSDHKQNRINDSYCCQLLIIYYYTTSLLLREAAISEIYFTQRWSDLADILPDIIGNVLLALIKMAARGCNIMLHRNKYFLIYLIVNIYTPHFYET